MATRDKDLLEELVQALERIAASFGQPWRVECMSTEAACLDGLYERLPWKFPPLFERFILSYRWAAVDIGYFELLPNPLGSTLAGLQAEILRDGHLYPTLFRHEYLQFGKAGGGWYDPVCFDCSRRKKQGDCPVVRLDHEEILCNERIRVTEELAPSFQELISKTLEWAEKIKPR